MSFELRTDQSVAHNLQRIFRKQIEAARRVAKGGIEMNDTRVHAIRKHLKRARAVLDLVRKSIGRRSYRRQDRWLRRVGRSMRQIRDAEVRLFTMRRLEDETHHHYLSYQKIERLLALELDSFYAAFDGWEAKAIRLLGKARRAAKKWPINGYQKKDFQNALRRSYRRACNALIAAVANPAIPNLHDLRKHVKRLGYQVQLLRPLNPAAVTSASDELTRLGDLLGDIHDLIVLAERLRLEREERHWGIQDEQLLALIHRKQLKLQDSGIETGARFFTDRPREFGRHAKMWFKSQVAPSNRQLHLEQLASG